MAQSADEWFEQASYDLETAEYMLRGGRRFYAVFMAHLAVEKAFKGIYQARLQRVPPRTHNLPYLLELAALSPPADKQRFLVELTAAQVATRYSEDMAKLHHAFGPERTRRILDDALEVIKWVRTQL